MKKLGVLVAASAMSLSAFAHENGTIKIYDGQLANQLLTIGRPKPLILKDGQRRNLIVPKKARVLNDNLEHIRDFYFNSFGRRSYDDKGADIKAYINSARYDFLDLFGVKANAYWSRDQKCFHFGDGNKKQMDDFEAALDVVAHEYTHAVIDSTSKLAYQGQSGALNEHLADVFGSIINQEIKSPANPYLIGETVLRGEYKLKANALRDMENPARGVSPQPSHMRDLQSAKYSRFVNCTPAPSNDNCGVHILSGIPNRLSVVIMKNLSLADSSKLFYNVMTKRLKENSNFADYARALRAECSDVGYGACAAVEEGLADVGL